MAAYSDNRSTFCSIFIYFSALGWSVIYYIVTDNLTRIFTILFIYYLGLWDIYCLVGKKIYLAIRSLAFVFILVRVFVLYNICTVIVKKSITNNNWLEKQQNRIRELVKLVTRATTAKAKVVAANNSRQYNFCFAIQMLRACTRQRPALGVDKQLAA